MRIRDIVNGRLPVKVRSIDLTTGEESWQPVVNWWRNGLTSTWARLWAPNGSRGNKPIRVTPNHHMWTPQGWREAGDLLPGDLIAVASPVPSGQQDQVILGSLLGDGSLSGRKRESSLPHLDEAHSVKQRGYMLWKAAALDSLGIATAETEQGDGTGKRHPVIRMRTAAIASLLKYRSMKPEDMLSQLGPLGLAVWFMDDGSISLNRDGSVASAILHCCGFSEDFAQAAVAWLADLGVDAVVRHGGGYPRVAANSKDADALLELIQSWMIRDGSHKIWCGGHVEQGHGGYAFVPVLRNELSVRPHREQRYDIEVANTHTMIANGFVTSNCTEADVYRKAFPQDFSGIYLDDAMPPDTPPGRRSATRAAARAGHRRRSHGRRPAAGDDTRSQPRSAAPAPAPGGDGRSTERDPDPRAAGAAPDRGAQPPPPQDGKDDEKHRKLVGAIQGQFKRLGYAIDDDDREERVITIARLARVAYDPDRYASTSDFEEDDLKAAADTLARCRTRDALDALLKAGEVDG